MNNVVEVYNVSKDFISPGLFWKSRKTVSALNNVSLSIEKGGCLGLLGPNGAGKTTLLKTISTLILPDKGEVTVCRHSLNKDDEKIRSLIGLLITDERSFYWRLTGRHNLEFFASLYGLNKKEAGKRIDRLFSLFKIDYANRRFDSYSTGMKRKFALARALLHEPAVLLLDEPTRSLDFNSSQELRELVKKLSEEDTTIILATHDMAEAESLCDSFAILHNGRIKKTGTLKQLLQTSQAAPSAGLSEVYLKLTKNG